MDKLDQLPQYLNMVYRVLGEMLSYIHAWSMNPEIIGAVYEKCRVI